MTAIMKFINREGMPKIISWKKGVLPMKNQEQYKRLIRAAFCFTLLFVHALLFWCVWRGYYSLLMETQYWKKGHWMILAFYLFWSFILPRVYGGWKVGYLRIFNVIYSQILGIIMTNVLMYCLVTLLTKHFENAIPLIIMTVCQFLLISIWGVVSTRLYRLAYPPRKVLLVYGEHPALGLMKKIGSRTDRFEIGEMVHIPNGSGELKTDETEWGEIREIEKKIALYDGVVICDIPSHERNQILKYCYGKGVRCYTTPKISDLIIRSAESQHMFDTPLLLSRNNGLTIEQRVIKRVVDIILSVIALIPALPLMAVTALLIKIEDGGSIIYKQKRLTQDGREFYVYKFRSMREDAEKDGVARLAGEHDDRITKVGRVIRAIRFDELPQLLNILKGDMSIVGPRPERPEIAAEYEKEIPEFAYRLKVKAGLTGYAQVYGKYNTTAYDKLKLDLMYIQNYNIRLDFEIMFKTVQILFIRESTEGMEAGQIIALTKEQEGIYEREK